jgi:hypothetical protein
MRYRWLFALFAFSACGDVRAPAGDAGIDACAGAACSDAATDAPPPMSYPPAAVWIAPGGGAATANAQINVSFGARYGAGTATAPSGATLTSGFLTTDTD